MRAFPLWTVTDVSSAQLPKCSITSNFSDPIHSAIHIDVPPVKYPGSLALHTELVTKFVNLQTPAGASSSYQMTLCVEQSLHPILAWSSGVKSGHSECDLCCKPLTMSNELIAVEHNIFDLISSWNIENIWFYNQLLTGNHQLGSTRKVRHK